ncbi:carboxypeptidase-like regulatory domain-containing protein [Seonamhaeicola sp. MEBiC1930]|uniref:carboxypeptidase-like regulatory domain-containing protein n=1 Tax=Seonamhaeicola sp. MEBiC01930 TaxID=2976768 RepID=UPI00325007BF
MKNRKQNSKKFMVLRVIVVTFLLNLCFTQNTFAQFNSSTKVVGWVTDAEDNPLDGVTIEANGEGAKTKSDGRFELKLHKSHNKNIEVSISKLGYKRQTIKVNTSKSKKELKIQLISDGNSLAKYQIEKVRIEPEVLATMQEKWGNDFVHAEYPKQYLNNVITLNPGDDVQVAIDKANKDGGGIVFLTEGVHTADNLKIKSKVTLCGAGRDKTVLRHVGEGHFMSQAEKKLTDVVFKDITLRGGENTKSGLGLRGQNDDRHERFMWQNVNITGINSHGIGISRVNHIIMDNSHFQSNGLKGSLHHNVYFLFVSYVLQSDCDMSNPAEGKSNKYTSTSHLLTQRCVMKNGKGNGIQADNDQGGYLFFHKHHLSGFARVAMWFPCEEYYNKFQYTEDPKWVPQNVVLNRCEVINNGYGAMWRVVGGKSSVINSHFDNDKLDMGLLKCKVEMDENSVFKKGNESYDDVKEWPKNLKLLG